MKRNYFLLVLLSVVYSLSTNAQIINFADPDLKTYILSETPWLDTNADGEIQLTEAQALTQFAVSGAEISDMGGMEAFTNLIQFDCTWTGITSLDLTSMTHLKMVNCGSNHLTSLNVTGLTELEHLEAEFNNLTSLDVSTLTSLSYLMFDYNELETIDLTGLTHLRVLSCPHNNLTSMTFPSYPNQLLTVACGENLFESLDFTQIGAVEFSENEFPLLTATNCPNLAYVNLKNSFFNYLTTQSFQDCPNLHYICADETEIEEFANSFASQGIQMNSYCTFIPGGGYNTISGNVSFDLNNDGCDAADLHQPGIKLSINDGSVLGNVFTTATGNYAFYTAAGSFTIVPFFENPYFTVSPASATISFPAPDSLTQTQNFCIIPNGNHNDLEATLLTSPIRPGFDSYFTIVYKNKGNQIQSGTINLSFDDSLLDLVASTPMTSSQTPDSLSWEFTNLQPFETRSVNFVLNANAPTETPPLTIGDQLDFTATINPSDNDETPLDNTSASFLIVTGSFDPNDKTCLEGETISPEKVGDFLHYVIRFQNSGTAAAENVVVKDLIDPSKFDIASLELTASSHQQLTRITDNKVEFIFENINLPAEQDDEPASHGYVAFKIKTRNDLVLGDTASNTADIFFDYNFPVVTNTASTTVSELGINEFENTDIDLSPNPVKTQLAISSKNTITSVQLFDAQGRLVETVLNNNFTKTLDLSGQKSGMYILKIYTDNGMKVHKIIKE